MSTGVVAHRRPSAPVQILSLSRLALLLMGAGVPLLTGCTTTQQDPIAMIPPDIQASVIAEEHMRQAREAANAGDPNAKPTSVQAILARARAAEATSPTAEAAAAGPAPAGAAPPQLTAAEAAAATTGSIAPAGAARAAPPKRTAPPREFEVTFQGAEETPGGAEAAAFAKAWQAGKVPAKAQVMITAGPGPGATAFDQALLANKRLRTVRSLLPADLDAKQLYDPDMIPDTVRIVVGAPD
ncbi:hypothetical protein [Azorhizobium sp. AG788]|uniref:hypothetical protein n=1 Tax=Azorhizobium sp. AG788 TaxID=2183897 RepID=UPI0031398B90